MKHFARALVVIAFASVAPLAFGQVTIWNNTGLTQWEQPLSWSNGVPTNTSFTYLIPGATSSTASPNTFFTGGVPNLIVRAQTDNVTDILYVINGFPTGNTSPQLGVAGVTFADVNNVSTTLNVGSDVIVSGTTLTYSGNMNVLGSVDIGGLFGLTNVVGPISGNATMNFSNGVLTTGDLLIGSTNNGTSHLTASGTFVQSGGNNSSVFASNVLLGVNGGSGSYTISGSGVNNFTLGGGIMQIGNATFTQNDAASTVDLATGSGQTTFGVEAGNVSTYNLQAGTLLLGDTKLGGLAGTTSLINQTAGTLIGSGTIQIGSAGTGTYLLSGGTADFQTGFSVGGGGATGNQVTQAAGTSLTAEGLVKIGGSAGSGTGTYLMQGGNTTFSNGLTVDSTGTFTQLDGTITLGTGASVLKVNSGGVFNQGGGTGTGGTVVVDATLGQQIDLSAVGGTYTLYSGGLLKIGDSALVNGLVGTTGQGNLNFHGGTLQITSTNAGSFTDGLDSVLSGSSTINASLPGTTNVTFSGNLSGSGSIVFVGTLPTVFNLTGDNTYTGGTTITRGTLNLGPNSSGIITSNSLTVEDSATLNLNLAAPGMGYTGNLNGGGHVNVNFFNPTGDVLALSNINGFTGSMTLGNNGNSGTLQVFSGTLNSIDDNGSGSNVTIGGFLPFGLPGGFIPPTSGTVNLGTTTYTGLTTISNGFTAFATHLAGDALNHGTFGSNAPLSAITGPPTLTIDGNLVSDNTLVFRMSNDGTAVDQIQVNGTANVSGHVILENIAGSGQFVVLNTNAAGDLTPGLIFTDYNSPLLKVSVIPDPSAPTQRLILVLDQEQLSTVALTPNQNAVANALDPLIIKNNNSGTPFPKSFTSILAALDHQSLANAPLALEQLSPEVLQYSRNLAFQNSNFMVQNVNNAMSNIRHGYGGLDTSAVSVTMPGFTKGLGRSLMANASFHPTAPNGVNYYPDDQGGGLGPYATPAPSGESQYSVSTNPLLDDGKTMSDSPVGQTMSDMPVPLRTHYDDTALRSPSNFSEFIGGDMILADLNSTQSKENAPIDKAKSTGGDAYAGIGFKVTHNLVVGALFDYNHTEAKIDAAGSDMTVDTYTPGIFATFADHGFYVNGLMAFGYNTYSNERRIGFLGRTANSSPNGQTYTGNLDFGYDFHPDKNWIVGPTLGATYVHVNVQQFTEQGAGGANLTVHEQQSDSLRSRLGAHAIYQTLVGNIMLQPNVTAMWQHEYIDQTPGITSQFNIPGTNPYTILTPRQDQDSGLIGCGLTATLNNTMSFYFNYMTDIGARDYFAQTFVGGFNATF